MPTHIVPASRPDLALTVITKNGAASLALLPKDPGNPLQLFDTVALKAEAKPAAVPDHGALLLRAGARASLPAIPADYIGDGHILDFIIAFTKGDSRSRYYTILDVTGGLLRHASLSESIASAALLFYGIPIDAALLGSYLSALKQATPNKGLTAFFKRVIGDKAMMHRLIAAASDYTALAREITALGFAIDAQQLQNYLSPWVFFASVLAGLKANGTITDVQFQAHIGYATVDFNVTGLGPEADLVLIDGLLSASGWVTKLDAFSDFGLPMQLLMIPVSTIMIDSLTNQHNFTFKQLGPMMFDGFTDALQATAQGLQDFGNDVSSVF